MTADERIAKIAPKLDRAKKHFRDLETEIIAFLYDDPRPYEIATKKDVNTGETIYYISGFRPLPINITLLIGDVLQNCRTALDHFAHQLVLANNGTPTTETAYPIFDDATQYGSRKVRKIQGMRQDGIDIIDQSSPYKSGNTALWQLHRLNNIDKHRLLVTATPAYRGRSIQESEWLEFRRIFGENLPAGLSRIKFVSANGESVPLENGHEIFRSPAGSEVDENMQLSVEVAFAEPRIAQGDLVLKTLQRMLDMVHAIIYGSRSALV